MNCQFFGAGPLFFFDDASLQVGEPAASVFNGMKELNPVTTQETAENTCDLCSKTFKSKSSPKEHERRHTGEMPYSCSHSGCSFKGRWRSSLQNHRRYHKNEESVEAPAQRKQSLSKRAMAQPVVEDDAGSAIEIGSTTTILLSDVVAWSLQKCSHGFWRSMIFLRLGSLAAFRIPLICRMLWTHKQTRAYTRLVVGVSRVRSPAPSGYSCTNEPKHCFRTLS